MSLPEQDEIKRLAIGDLRSLVESLLAEVVRLQEGVAALRAENAALKEEIARLKGLPPRPKLKPSGMEKAANAVPGPQPSGKAKRKRRRGAKRHRLVIGEERVLAAAAPAGSRFKGYEDIVVQDLLLVPRVIRYRRERWLTPEGRTIIAPLPAGIVGGFGPALRRFVLAGHVQGQVTSERLTALLAGIGITISKRQVVRLLTGRLDALIAEDREVLRAGLASAPWITVDDTGAVHAGRNGVTTQIGDGRFTAFRTSLSKSRTNFLDCLRAGHDDYVVDEAAVAYMRRHHLAGPVIDRLTSHPQCSFPDRQAWTAHLEALGITALEVLPDPVKIATQGAMWGAIRRHGLLRDTVVVSDDAGQFRVGTHALCWVHAERLIHKLLPVTDAQRRAVDLIRQLIWWLYRDLKAWQGQPDRRRAAALRSRFDRIFKRRTGYVTLDRLLARLYERKAELLRVLDRPEIPLHTNASENDIRAHVTKRKISGGTQSEAGRVARDVLLGLMKTCAKLGISFFAYLGSRLGVPDASAVPRLAQLVQARAAA
jgi:Transposase IS66 family